MVKIRHKHPFAVRWFHWINFPVIFIMIWSGTCIYWAYDEYSVKYGDTVLIDFYPEPVFNALNTPYKLATGMGWHFTFMWLFALNGMLYLSYLIFSGQWRYILPERRSMHDAFLVVLNDLGIKKSSPDIIKYNAAQKIAYSIVLIMGAGSLITGVAIYKPVQLSWLTEILGGYRAARLEHFALNIGFLLFFVVHIVQVVRAGWNNMRAMITGFEKVNINNPERLNNERTRIEN
jgi:thiosulfate reductase cytochrome b subunit